MIVMYQKLLQCFPAFCYVSTRSKPVFNDFQLLLCGEALFPFVVITQRQPAAADFRCSLHPTASSLTAPGDGDTAVFMPCTEETSNITYQA